MNKQPLYISAGNCQLCVFRVGKSPRLSAGTEDATQSIMKCVHTHFTYEIFLVVEGTLTLVTEDYTAQYRDKIVIIPPRLRHDTHFGQAECYCLLFSFSEVSDRAAAIKEQLDEGIQELEMTPTVAFYIRQFTQKFLENTETAEQAARHLAALIFGEVLTFFKQEKDKAIRKIQRRSRHISAVEEHINLNLHNKFSLEDVAAAVYLSTRQINRIIEGEYRCSFSQLVMNKRLDHCEMLLKNTDMKIGEIAEQFFPDTPNYFYTVFKRRYGMTPAKYRAELRTRG